MHAIFRLTYPTLFLLLAACAGTTIEQSDLGATGKTEVGLALVDSGGMTLYTFDQDQGGQPTCRGACAIAWPPALAMEGAAPGGDFTLVERGNGERQWAYKGNPLYGYFLDGEPGDASGDGVDGVWHAAKP